MNDTVQPASPQQSFLQNLIDELIAVPVAKPEEPERTLEIPRACLLREWMELYWAALERPEFLDWASRFHIDLDTLRIKGATLEARAQTNGTASVRTFALDDDSGWWQVAPALLWIAQRIDPGEMGLPYIGGKSANPLYRFPRRIALAFYGYPEPQNEAQTKVIVAELKADGLAAIDENGHTTSAVVKERDAQLEDFQAIANTLETVLKTHDPFEQRGMEDTAVSLTSASVSASRGGPRFKLGPLLERYALPIPEDAEQAKALVQRLRDHRWPDLPYVSEYVQTGSPILSHRHGFADVEDGRYILRRLQALCWNQSPMAKINLEEFSEPHPDSALAEWMALGQRELRTFGTRPAFQAILKKHGLPADSPLLLSATGHVGTASDNGWITLTAEVEKHADLKVYRDRLKVKAREAGGAFRDSGKVTLGQMLRFYELPLPETVEQALNFVKWDQINLHVRPGYMNHWYLLGQPGKQTERFTAEQRQQVIDTTQAFLPKDAAPLIDYLSEGVDTDLPVASLNAKADYLIGRILITRRAQDLGNQLLEKIARPAQPKELLATNRDRLLLAALILSLDPKAGEQSEQIIDQAVNDSFYWGERYDEVRRFIDRQFALALIKNKSLATHLLLSGIAPEFLIRDIPTSFHYMSCVRWVRFKQVVLYIEDRLPGVARLMTYAQLITLTNGPAPSDFYRFLRSDVCTAVVLDWAVARGVVQRDEENPANHAATLKRAESIFRDHYRRMRSFSQRAFLSKCPTPATVALADLRKVFIDNPHLKEQALFNSGSGGKHFSLSELHVAGKLTGDLQGWQSNNTELQLPSIKSPLARLGKVSSLFRAALSARLRQMKDAHVAFIKDAFCRLPLAQRQDIEDNTLELFALQLPAPTSRTKTAKPNAEATPFAIIALLRGSVPRVYEIFTRRAAVTLRRDIDLALLTPSSANAKAKSLPFDAEAYRHGTLPIGNATCEALLTRLDIEGAPLAPQTHSDVPDTFASNKVNAIASTAVRHLFEAYESKALQEALIAPALEDVHTNQEKWLKFYATLSPPKT
ncbi:hypothetical protein SAMN05216496_3677 [Pseudomonas sp. Z003-0.4C(8344-21)]|uniref:hypothetical protein n=1 Tax=Pseudomonas sp. Z003-0.4C(8344-21) TaxID=1855380 RepID=UPI00087A38B6|nr:hypothetical protein [Pseudomonas sp. Z003-0.4C(8344-21)]SDT22664.1 hypothetical protein SAMN05216496_3677 [Pseudomonas sp. Z003-0.4C(8344-21)]